MAWRRFMNLSGHIDSYLELHRGLGYKYRSHERVLRAYERHVAVLEEPFLRSSSMLTWAEGTRSPEYGRARLRILHRFAVWLHLEDSRHEVPDPHALGRRNRTAKRVRLWSPTEIALLLSAARDLEPRDSIRPYTYHYFFGLIASTGMRRCEGMSLLLSDYTPDGFVIRDTKFGKSRLVPLESTVHEAVAKYLDIRLRVAPYCNNLFVREDDAPLTNNSVYRTLLKLIYSTKIGKTPGKNFPTLHGLRHTFVVRAIENILDGPPTDVSRRMTVLATYLGHSCISSVYWYLQSTPHLFRKIQESLENYVPKEPSHA